MASQPRRIGLIDVDQSSIAQGRTKLHKIRRRDHQQWAVSVVGAGRNCSAFVLPHVINDTEIIAYLKQNNESNQKNQDN
jgi:hypothetical protein